jgi:hypothetical protein
VSRRRSAKSTLYRCGSLTARQRQCGVAHWWLVQSGGHLLPPLKKPSWHFEGWRTGSRVHCSLFIVVCGDRIWNFRSASRCCIMHLVWLGALVLTEEVEQENAICSLCVPPPPPILQSSSSLPSWALMGGRVITVLHFNGSPCSSYSTHWVWVFLATCHPAHATPRKRQQHPAVFYSNRGIHQALGLQLHTCPILSSAVGSFWHCNGWCNDCRPHAGPLHGRHAARLARLTIAFQEQRRKFSVFPVPDMSPDL